MSDDLRATLHRLVDELDEAQLPAALERLTAERRRRPPLTAADTQAALEELYGQPLPAGVLNQARAALGPQRRAS